MINGQDVTKERGNIILFVFYFVEIIREGTGKTEVLEVLH